MTRCGATALEVGMGVKSVRKLGSGGLENFLAASKSFLSDADVPAQFDQPLVSELMLLLILSTPPGRFVLGF